MRVDNPFNPMRITGRNGAPTVEEISRIQDLIRNSFAFFVRTLLHVPTVPGSATGGGPVSPSGNAYYWLSQADPTIPNGVDMHALGAGVLQQTVPGLLAIPAAFQTATGRVLFGAGGLLADSSNFYFDALNMRWGFGTSSPDPGALVTFRKSIDGNMDLFVTNSNAGANAAAGILIQAASTDTFGSPPYLAMSTFGRFFNPAIQSPPVPFWTAGSGTISFLSTTTGANFVLDLGNITGAPDFIVTARDVTGTQQQIMRLLYSGAFRLASLAAGGYVKATITDGELQVVSAIPVADVTGAVPNTRTLSGTSPIRIDGGASADLSANRTISILDFAGAGSRGSVPDPTSATGKFLRDDGTWASAGGGGTVTSVSGTAPITSTGGTTPAIGINDFVGSGASHARGAVPDPGAVAGATKFLREDATWAVPPDPGITQLTGDVTAGPGSGSQAATIANDAVTFAKMQNIATDRLIGRDTAGTGDPEELTVGGGVEFTGSGGIQRSALGGDVSALAGSNSVSIVNNAVSDAKLRDSGALSVIGRSANSSGDPADISAAAASDAVLRESGSTLGFGQVATGGIANDAVTNAKLRNSAATSVIGRAGGSAGDPADIVAGADGQVLWRDGGGLGFAPYPVTVNLTWDVSLAADPLIGTSGEEIPVGRVLSLDSISHRYLLADARAKCRLELLVNTNAFTGGGSWSVEIYKNGATCGVVLGPYTSTGGGFSGNTGKVTISGADGDVYHLVYLVTGTINTAASSLNFTANATFYTA